MDETNNSKKQTGAQGQPQATCPKSFKPWIFTLIALALLILCWVIYESYRDGGIAARWLGNDELQKTMQKPNSTPSDYYHAIDLPAVNTMQDSYHTIIEHVRPAIVSIDVAVAVPVEPELEKIPGAGVSPVAGAPVANYSRVGSGVIIADKGYILTSYHVIEGATAMKATVYGPGGANDYALKIVNIDKTTDLALLRLMGNGPFPHALLGDSDAVRTGDVVLAMGSPFGFDQTITTGIVSSRNRTVSIGPRVFEGMFQTDTPLNKGNSGGPLVSAHGEVIAINTAIYSPSGTFSGIGFAIPINQASSLVGGVVDFGGTPQVAGGQLAAWAKTGRQTGNAYKLANGQVITPPHPYRGKCVECHPQLLTNPELGAGKGLGTQPAVGRTDPQNNAVPVAQGALTSDPYLGASLLNVDALIAKQFNLVTPRGVLVDSVTPGSPADIAGIKRGDVILRFDGRRLQDITDLQNIISTKKIGTSAELVLMSNGVRKTIKIKLKIKVKIDKAPVAPNQAVKIKQPAEFEWLGVEIKPLPPVIQGYVNSGVYVAEKGGILGAAGVMKGDVIKSVNNQAVPDLLTFIKIAKKLNVKDGILLDVIRSGKPMYITIKG